MDLVKARENLYRVTPRLLDKAVFVRAYNARMITAFHRKHLFDSTWSYRRGYRYNFKETHPVCYFAGDHLVASTEIGPRTYDEFLLPYLKIPHPPYIYVSVRVTAQVLDLTDRQTRRYLGVTLPDILIPTEEWEDKMKRGVYATTHKIGRLALEDDRFDGILFPPYPVTSMIKLKGKHCLAIYMDPKSEAMAKPNGRTINIEVVDTDDFLKNLGLVF
ncbi:hypothetical protein BMS3Abin09_01248 [bacterium BMS3Abin09]|nr:hypothetical protein BMS3Abin09_01248 [bacterium BMS3Abin09]GBE40163.1 hypothetical protein BMS3Bbin09_00036 [bacterium BMS3Bbin09]HDH33938.1 hypothetical protein [Nitrospirota bacterium]